ncbi:MAG: hypothetical protein AB7P60_21095, partial [Hyphomicrobiaceae bacterium]
MTAGSVSINRHVYDRFRARCDELRVPMAQVLKQLLAVDLGAVLEQPRPYVRRAPVSEHASERVSERVSDHVKAGQGAPRLSEHVLVTWPEAVAELVYDSLPPADSRGGAERTRTSSPLRPLEASQALDAAIVRMLDAYSWIAERATHCAICRVRRGRVDFVPLLAGESVVAVCRACV